MRPSVFAILASYVTGYVTGSRSRRCNQSGRRRRLELAPGFPAPYPIHPFQLFPPSSGKCTYRMWDVHLSHVSCAGARGGCRGVSCALPPVEAIFRRTPSTRFNTFRQLHIQQLHLLQVHPVRCAVAVAQLPTSRLRSVPQKMESECSTHFNHFYHPYLQLLAGVPPISPNCTCQQLNLSRAPSHGSCAQVSNSEPPTLSSSLSPCASNA